MEERIDYAGHDLKTVYAATAKECQEKCTSDFNCVYWSFYPMTRVMRGSGVREHCKFKSSKEGRRWHASATSGSQCEKVALPVNIEEALADAFEVALPAQEDSTTTPQEVVLRAFAALGVAVLAYGAFKYYTKKNADYQEIEV